MFTGYFTKLKEYKQTGLIPISISGKAPEWYDGLEYKKLAPKWAFFQEWKYGANNIILLTSLLELLILQALYYTFQ